MSVLRLFIAAVIFVLPLTASAGFENVRAAATFRSFDTELRFEDGAIHERHFRRAGIEYWEAIAEHVYGGFALGYSESEGHDAARPFETAAGNFGLLGLRVDAPLNDRFSLRGHAVYLLQRDVAGPVDALESRSREVRGEFGAVLHLRRLELSLGAVWRDLDYRDVVHDAGVESVRHAEGSDTGGGFAALGLSTGEGVIALRYDAGAESGWGLRFEQTF